MAAKHWFIALACVLVLGAGTAHAVEFKASGYWDISTYWINTNFTKNPSPTPFGANQRLQTSLSIIANEYVRGMLTVRVNNDWGRTSNPGDSSYGGSLGADGIDVAVHESYIDWLIPNIDARVRMGIQYMQFPGFIMGGSAIMGDPVAAIVMSKSFTENIAATLWWMRPYNDNSTQQVHDSMDGFGLSVPMTFGNVKLTPWGQYGRIGANTFTLGNQNGSPGQELFPFLWSPESVTGMSDNASLWYLGLTGELRFLDNARLAFDANYGNLDSSTNQLDRKGWYAALLGSYQFEHMTPGLLLWYASGDDANLSNGSERLPTIDSSWNGTSMGFDGYWQERGTGASVAGNDPNGTWGVAAQLTDLHVFDDIKHTLRLAYYQGTNDKNMANAYALAATTYPTVLGNSGFQNSQGLYLTEKDAVWEVNINTFYNIYENLIFGLELGWMSLDLDKSRWNVASYDNNAFRVIGTFRYSF